MLNTSINTCHTPYYLHFLFFLLFLACFTGLYAADDPNSMQAYADEITQHTFTANLGNSAAFHAQSPKDKDILKKQINDIFVEGIQKQIKKVQVYTLKKRCCNSKAPSHCVAFVFSIGMGLNLFSIYKGDNSPLMYVTKVAGFAGSIPLSMTGILNMNERWENFNNYNKRNKKKAQNKNFTDESTIHEENENRSRSIDITHAIATDGEVGKILEGEGLELALDQDYTKTTLIAGGVLATIDASFDAYLAGKTGYSIIDSFPHEGKVVMSVLTGVWNFIPGWGCAFLGALSIAQASYTLVNNGWGKISNLRTKKSSTNESTCHYCNIDHVNPNSELKILIATPPPEQKDAIYKKVCERLTNNLDVSRSMNKMLQERRKILEDIDANPSNHDNTQGCICYCASRVFKIVVTLLVSAGIGLAHSADTLLDSPGAIPLTIAVGVIYLIQGFNITILAEHTISDTFQFARNWLTKDTRDLINKGRPGYFKSRFYGGTFGFIAGSLYLWNYIGTLQPVTSLLNLWAGANVMNGTIIAANAGINGTMSAINATIPYLVSMPAPTVIGTGVWLSSAFAISLAFAGGAKLVYDAMEPYWQKAPTEN